VTNTVGQLAMVLFLGTANAAAVMIGNRIGAGDRDRAFAWARRFAIMAPIIGVIVGTLLVPASLALPWLFAIGSEPLRQARLMLVALAFVFPFKVFNLHVIIGICRSGGDTRFGAFFDIFGIWAIGVPLAVLGAFVLRLEPWIVFAMLNSEEIAKCGFGLWRLVTKRWLNDVTV
jgi:Na+-driven multidrug efflux pump